MRTQLANPTVGVSPPIALFDRGPEAPSWQSTTAIPPSAKSHTTAAQIDIFQKLINGLPEQIALLDAQWNVLATNTAWAQASRLNGFDELRRGSNYRRAIEAELRKCRTGVLEAPCAVTGSIDAVVTALEEFEAGKRTSYRYVHRDRDEGGREFHVRIGLMELNGSTFATLTRYDVADLAELRQLREDFNNALIETRDDERRRMAREIHDSTMQLLAGLGLAVGQLQRTDLQGEGPRLAAAIEDIVGRAQRELRTISYLSHPPELDRMGLAEALHRLVKGFGRRTGLEASFEGIGDAPVLRRHAQMAIYRTVQEALANVHRHARATSISLRLVSRRGRLHVVVIDDGCGIAPDSQVGVGMMSMRSRLAELGGRLMVRNLRPGTAIVASLLI